MASGAGVLEVGVEGGGRLVLVCLLKTGECRAVLLEPTSLFTAHRPGVVAFFVEN